MKINTLLDMDIYDNFEEAQAATKRGEKAAFIAPRPEPKADEEKLEVGPLSPELQRVVDSVMEEQTQKMEKANKDWVEKNVWRPTQHEPGAKLDQGKPEAALLLDFGKALTAVAEVSTYGANKYTRGGWQKVDDAEHRYKSAMLRHLFNERYAEVDEESQLLHLAHLAWNALAILELRLRHE